MNKNINKQNTEVINGVLVDWNKFKGTTDISNINRSKNCYIKLCEIAHKRGHKILSEYTGSTDKILIDYGKKAKWVTVKDYKYIRKENKNKYDNKKELKAKNSFFKLLHDNGHDLLSEYINNDTEVLVNFNCKCDPYWIAPAKYKQKHRKTHKCRKCNNNIEQAKKDFIKLIEINGHVLLSDYKNTSTKVLINYKCCNYQKWITPSCYKTRSDCPKCNNKAKISFMEALENNGHILISKYTDNKTKVLVDYKCGCEPYEITPLNYKQSRYKKCPRCLENFRYDKKALKIKKKFLDLLETNGYILLSDYIDDSTEVLIDFNCGHEPSWIKPSECKDKKHLLCDKCKNEERRKRKESEFLDIINRNGHKLIGEYVNSYSKVLVDYKCGCEPYEITPSSYKQNKSDKCPRCKRRMESGNRFEIIVKNNGHTLLSEYINSETKVLIDFNCGHEPSWIKPQGYKNSNLKCPKCMKIYIKNYTENSRNKGRCRLENEVKNNGHTLLSEYINSETKVLIDFNCGHEPHWIKTKHYYSGKGCPLCKNKGESALHKLLLDMGYKVENQKTYNDLRDKACLRYDFYLPEFNLLIELDGEHHREQISYIKKDMSDFEKEMEDIDGFIRLQDRKRKDKLKNDYAKNNNIPLLRIEYNKSNIELNKWRELILNKIYYIENNKTA